MTTRSRRSVGSLAALTMMPWALAAQSAGDQPAPAGSAPRVGTAVLVSAPPTLDGRLDDAAWESAARLGGFVQRELREGDAVTERTEVRILTDGDALYVGAWLFDRDTAGIVPGEKLRDVSLSNSDYFGFILDTYHDRQNGFVFATTPSGVEYDGQVIREGEGAGLNNPGQARAVAGSMGGFNLNWDGSWTVATSVDSAGWYAEFRIPFSTLRYGGEATQTWGLNIVRGIRRKNEEAFWSFIPRQFSLYRLSRAGTLEGIRVPVRRTATVTPYVLGGMQRNYAIDPRARDVSEFGTDLKYGVTPSLTLDLTYNTDFAQAEVDEQRTNLTRFPLFFPEKRQFFLENAGVFSAGTPQAVDLFFSRRIGIDTLGNPVPVHGGGRLSGRVGAFTVGALQIFTGRAEGVQPANSYSVGRVTRELSARSRVGLIAVHRTSTDDGDDRNTTVGLDGRIGVGDAWTVDWWGAKTETPGRPGDDVGFSARGAYETGAWENSLRYIQVGEDFDPQVGFLNRRGGYRLYDVMVMRKLRKAEWPWLKEWNPHVSYRAHVGLDGYYQSGRIHIDVTEVELANGGRFGPDLNIEHEGLREPFEIADGVIVPPGSYSWPIFGLDLITDPSAPLSLSMRAERAGLYDGTRTGGNATVTVRRGASLTTSLVVDYHDVHLDEGEFTRYLVGTKLGYYFTPRLFALSLVQYSNQARVWTANARFGWLNTAGTGLFVVYNDGREADGFFDWVRPQARSMVLKYTRQFGR
jgi:hypothetical protein